MPASDVRSHLSLDRILFATDSCPTAGAAATYAAGLARRFSSTLELVTVVDLSIGARFGHSLMGPAVDAFRHCGEEGLHKLATELSGITVQKTVGQGFTPADVIVDAAEQSRSDMIVLPPSFAHGGDSLASGSTAEDIIRRAGCAVLSVGPRVARAPSGPLRFRRILCATDLSPQAKKAAQYAFTLAEDLAADLCLVHVLSAEEEKTARKEPAAAFSPQALHQLVPESPSSHCHPECVVEHGRAPEAILRLAKQVGADLIVLGARKCSFWLAYVKSGVTPALLAEARCPVLSVC